MVVVVLYSNWKTARGRGDDGLIITFFFYPHTRLYIAGTCSTTTQDPLDCIIIILSVNGRRARPKKGQGSDEQNYAVIIKIIMKHTYSFFSNRVPKTTTNYYFGNYNCGGQGGYVFARVQLYDIYYSPLTRVPIYINIIYLCIYYYTCMCSREYVCVSDIITR